MIPKISFEGVTATDVKIEAIADASLSFTVGSLANGTEGTLNGIFAVSDTDFSSKAKRFKTSFSTKWSDAPGSSVDLIWAADQNNAQGANTPEDAPGVAYDAFTSGTVSGDDTANHSNSGDLVISPLFSLTVQGSIDLAPGGTESASESTTVASVPETSTWIMLIAGFAGLGIAGRQVSRKRRARGLIVRSFRFQGTRLNQIGGGGLRGPFSERGNRPQPEAGFPFFERHSWVARPRRRGPRPSRLQSSRTNAPKSGSMRRGLPQPEPRLENDNSAFRLPRTPRTMSSSYRAAMTAHL